MEVGIRYEQGQYASTLTMSDNSFRDKYRDLEDRMRTLAEEEGDVFVPSPEPEGLVQYVFICMEPSMGGSSAQELQARIAAGGRNFLNSVEPTFRTPAGGLA